MAQQGGVRRQSPGVHGRQMSITTGCLASHWKTDSRDRREGISRLSLPRSAVGVLAGVLDLITFAIGRGGLKGWAQLARGLDTPSKGAGSSGGNRHRLMVRRQLERIGDEAAYSSLPIFQGRSNESRKVWCSSTSESQQRERLAPPGGQGWFGRLRAAPSLWRVSRRVGYPGNRMKQAG